MTIDKIYVVSWSVTAPSFLLSAFILPNLLGMASNLQRLYVSLQMDTSGVTAFILKIGDIGMIGIPVLLAILGICVIEFCPRQLRFIRIGIPLVVSVGIVVWTKLVVSALLLPILRLQEQLR